MTIKITHSCKHSWEHSSEYAVGKGIKTAKKYLKKELCPACIPIDGKIIHRFNEDGTPIHRRKISYREPVFRVLVNGMVIDEFNLLENAEKLKQELEREGRANVVIRKRRMRMIQLDE
jgi:hypothetical protein